MFRFYQFTILIVVSFLYGCGGNEPLDTGKTLRLGNGGEPRDLDPQTISGTPETTILSALLEGLVTYHPTDDNVPYPGAAESWSLSEDGTEWTFVIRDDARWSNGDPVLASDFVYAWRRALTPELGCEYADWLYMFEGAEAYNHGRTDDFTTVGIRAIEPKVLSLKLIHPIADFLKILLNHTFLPVHPPTVENFGGMTKRNSGWTQAEFFVGNGPFQLVEWLPNSLIRVARNSFYWDAQTVKLDAIEFYPISDENTELRAFESNQLHITNSTPANKRDWYQLNQPETIRIDPFLGIYYLWVNTKITPLNNPEVRHALSYAINRKDIVEHLTKGGEQPARSYTPPNIGNYTPPKLVKDDVAKARELLAQAGFPDGENFPSIELVFNTSDNHRKIAEALQQMWKSTLNIDITLANQEWQVYLNSLSEFDYAIARAGWVGNLYPSSFLRNFLSYSPNNNCGFKDRNFDHLLEEAMQTTDEVKRNELYFSAEKILLEALPVIPIYYYTNSFLIKPEVVNWNAKLTDLRSLKFVDLKPISE